MRSRPIPWLLWRCTFQLYNLPPSKSSTRAAWLAHSSLLRLLSHSSKLFPCPENSPHTLVLSGGGISLRRDPPPPVSTPLLQQSRLLSCNPLLSSQEQGGPLEELSSAPPRVRSAPTTARSTRQLRFLLNSDLFCVNWCDMWGKRTEFWFPCPSPSQFCRSRIAVLGTLGIAVHGMWCFDLWTMRNETNFIFSCSYRKSRLNCSAATASSS